MKSKPPELTLLTSSGWQDYELLDSGDGQKLERYGTYIFVRPDHRAIWQPALSQNRWKAAHAVFQARSGESAGQWAFHKPIKPFWAMQYKGEHINLRFRAHAGDSRQMGVFPEQAAHWDWMAALIKSSLESEPQHPPRVLNLFGYTGLATLAVAQAGAHVTHIDASKRAITQARTNQELSGLSDRTIRWLVDDVSKFVQREARRGATYEGLILDPPKFGRGPKGQVWEFFTSLPGLLKDCRAILGDRPLFVALTAYALGASALTTYYALEEIFTRPGKTITGKITAGELALVESSAGRCLSTSTFARWQADG